MSHEWLTFVLVGFLSEHCAFASLSYEWNDTFSFTFQDTARSYHIAYWDDFLLTDSNYKYPVIYGIHGYTGEASSFIQQSSLHIDAAPRGYLTIYPEGSPDPIIGDQDAKSWNAGSCCGTPSKQDPKPDDSGFLMEILNDLESQQNISIDRNRIYMTGNSNGGRMAIRMACEYNTEIAAIAPNIASPSFVDVDECAIISRSKCDDNIAIDPVGLKCWDETAEHGDCSKDHWFTCFPDQQYYECDMSDRVVPILAFNGYLDPLCLWNGGLVPLKTGGAVIPNWYIARWYAYIAGCDDYYEDILKIYNYGTNDETTSDLISYYHVSSNNSNDISTCISFQQNCNVNVTFCTSWIGGHAWSGGQYPDGCDSGCKSFLGDISYSIDNTKQLLNFFDEIELDLDNDKGNNRCCTVCGTRMLSPNIIVLVFIILLLITK